MSLPDAVKMTRPGILKSQSKGVNLDYEEVARQTNDVTGHRQLVEGTRYGAAMDASWTRFKKEGEI